MTDRFLRYSLEHNRRILLIVQDDAGRIKRINLTVRHMNDDTVYYTVGKSTREIIIPRSSILSASYARGDEGDTLKNEE